EEVTANSYVVQFDSDGVMAWVQTANDTNNTLTGFIGKPSADELGNVYVTGYSYNNNTFGDFTFYNYLDTNGFPIFAKLDSTGNVVFATNASTNNDNSGKVTSYSNNKVAVGGKIAGNLYWGDVSEDNPENYNQLYNPF